MVGIGSLEQALLNFNSDEVWIVGPSCLQAENQY
jgi:hypothetical protein